MRPIYLRVKADRLRELAEDELGSWEDAERDGETEGHIYRVLTRHESKIEIRSMREWMDLLSTLDNSMDKAEGWADFYGDADARSWLGWLKSLDARVRREMTRAEAIR